MIIKIPERLNGHTFYSEILRDIYYSILQKDFEINFDMTGTKLANPEGFVNLISAALMIKNKYNYIPVLHLPMSENLLSYMKLVNFFLISRVPLCEAFRFVADVYGYSDEQKKRFYPKIHGIFVHSQYNSHYKNTEKIISDVRDNLDKIGVKIDEHFLLMLQSSLNQLIKNTLEHNPNHRMYGALGYYMAQKTPYNTFDFSFSDVGQGYRDRMVSMLNMKDPEAIAKYGDKEFQLKDNTYLFQQHVKNPNLIAISEAVNFRSDSNVPGVFQIKEFVANNGGHITIHSGNYMVKFSENTEIVSHFYNSYFSGCHLKFEIPLERKKDSYE